MRFMVARDHTSLRLTYILEGLVPPNEASHFHIVVPSDKLNMTVLCWCRTILVGHRLFSSDYRTGLLYMKPRLLEMEYTCPVTIFEDLHVSIIEITRRACATSPRPCIIIAWCDCAAATGQTVSLFQGSETLLAPRYSRVLMYSTAFPQQWCAPSPTSFASWTNYHRS